MSLPQLRNIDINTKEEEALVQAVVSLKTVQQPPAMQVQRIDVPDIKDKATEEKWQKIIDERITSLKPEVKIVSDASGIEIKVNSAVQKNKLEPGMVKCEICGKTMKERGLKLHIGKYHKVK